MYNHLMKRSASFLCALAIAALSGCATTAERESTADQIPEEGVDFKVALKQGDAYDYKLSLSMEGTAPAGSPGGTSLSMKIDIDQECEVTEVKDGHMRIVVTNADVKASGPEAAAVEKMLGSATSTFTIDEKGRMIRQEGALDAGGGAGGTIYFPDKKVRPGDTWEKNSPMQSGGQAIIAKYKFEAVHVLDGNTVARISMTPRAASEDIKMEGRYDYFIDLDTAMIVKMDAKVTTTAGGQTVVTKVAMSRL